MGFMRVILPCMITIRWGQHFEFKRLTGLVNKMLPKRQGIELWNKFFIRQVKVHLLYYMNA